MQRPGAMLWELMPAVLDPSGSVLCMDVFVTF